MKTLLSKVLALVFAFFLIFPVDQTYAAFTPQNCAALGVTVTETVPFQNEYNSGQGQIKLAFNNLTPGQEYFMAMYELTAMGVNFDPAETSGEQIYNGSPLEFAVNIPSVSNDGGIAIVLHRDTLGVMGFNEQICEVGRSNITFEVPLQCEYQVTQTRTTPSGQQSCDIMTDPGKCVDRTSDLVVKVTVKDENGNVVNGNVDLQINSGLGWDSARNSKAGNTFTFSKDSLPATGSHQIRASIDDAGFNFRYCAPMDYNISAGVCQANNQPICGKDGGLQEPEPEPGAGAPNYAICSQIVDEAMQAECETCAGGIDGQDGVWTAVGCINRDPMDITKRLIQVGLGMGGGVALIMTLAGGFILSTSQGDPQKANQAKEMITNAVIGLLFVIFSVVILQFIGVTILNIPGFGTGTTRP